MKKISDTQAKTPSATTRTEEILDDINVLVGQISKAEDLCVSNLESLSSALDAQLLGTIVHNTEALVEFSFTQSNMLMGIAGYLLGDKGINPTANASSLLGKIKNNEPLFLGPTEGSKLYKDLLEEILTNYTSTSTGVDSSNATLNVVLSSIDGGNLDSLIELIKELQNTGNVENIEVLTTIQSLLKNLDELGKTEIDTELIDMKLDDVQLAIFNIGETFNELSNLERRMNAIDIKEINTGLETLSKLDFAKNLKNIVNNIKALPSLVEAITSINFKGITATKNKQLDIFAETISKLYKTLNHIEVLSSNDYEDALKAFSKDILPFFEKGKKDNGLVERISNISFSKFNKNTSKQITSFEFTILTFGDVLKSISKMIPIMSIIEGSKDDIFNAIETINTIVIGDKDTKGLTTLLQNLGDVNKESKSLTSFSKVMTSISDIFTSFIKVGILGFIVGVLKKPFINAIKLLPDIIEIINENVSVPEIKTSIDNIHPYAELMKDLAVIFGYVTLLGFISIPAMVGGLLLTGAIKVIFKVLGKSFEDISKLKIDKETKSSLDDITKIIIVMGGLMLVAALTGWLVVAQFANIMAFLGTFLIFLTSITVVIALVGGLMNFLKATAAIDAISQLGTLILSLTGCMIIGALFMLTGLWIEALIFGAVLTAFITMVISPFIVMGRYFKNAISGAKEISIIVVTCTLILTIGALLMMIPGFGVNALLFGVLVSVFVTAIVGTFILFSKYVKTSQGAAYGILGIILVSSLCIAIGAGIIEKYGWEKPVIFAGIVVTFTFLMVVAMIVLNKAAKNIVKGTLCMIAIVGITYLFGFALEKIAEAYKIFNDPAEAFICLGWVAAVITAFTGVIFGLGALMGTGVGATLFVAGVVALGAIVAAVWTLGEALKAISEGIKSIKTLSQEKDTINVDNIKNLIVSIKDIAENFDVLDKVSFKNIERSSKIINTISSSLSAISGVVKDTASLKIPIYNNDGSISGYRQLNPEDFKLVSDNVGLIVTSLADALGNAYDNNKKVFKGDKAKRVIKAVKGISNVLDNIANGIVSLSKLEIPKYNEDGTLATGTTKLEITSIKGFSKNVELIITSFCGALDSAYKNNKDLFKWNKATKVLKALKGVSDVINKFTDVIVKFANSEYSQYDVNGNPTGKKVHINDTIIGQMKGSIETLITAVLGSISEIYAKPEIQALFKGKKLKNATDAIKSVSAIIGGLGKGIVDLAGLYIKDENGKVVQMNSSHFVKAKQNLKDIITCILGGVDELTEDDNFKKFTEGRGLFGINSWDVPTNIKNNLDKVKPLIDSAIENINSINDAVKLLTPSKGKNSTGKVWTDLLSVIFDPLKSFEVEDDDTAKKKKKSIKESLENARSIINQINRLDEDKADKFIKLSQELRDLSLNVGDMSGLIEALNGKINDTLNKVSECLIESTNALQKSDEAHEKRNEVIKQNTAELKKVLETPMKVNVITNSDSIETSSSDTNINSTRRLSGLTSETPAASPDLSGTTSAQSDTTPIDNATLTSIAGNTSDILAALRELLEKQ